MEIVRSFHRSSASSPAPRNTIAPWATAAADICNGCEPLIILWDSGWFREFVSNKIIEQAILTVGSDYPYVKLSSLGAVNVINYRLPSHNFRTRLSILHYGKFG